jgi:hypothetical protein
MNINRNDLGFELRDLTFVKWPKRISLEKAAQLRRMMKEQYSPMPKNEYNLGDVILTMTSIEAKAFAQFYDAQFGACR